MKNKFLLIGALFSMTTLFGQNDISDARNYPVGADVTITGVASDGGELGGSIRYIQDETGGIPVYGFGTVSGVNRGDSVTVSGKLKDFSGLLEIDPISNLVNHGAGTEVPAWNINIVDLGETYEGRLVRIDNVTFSSGGNFAGGTNYTFTDGANNGTIRVNNGSSLVGQAIPSGAQTIVGLLSEYNGTYQLLPRDMNDIFGYTAPDKKIEVLVDGTPLLDGSTVHIGTAASTTMELKNIGINNLTVSNISFGGAAAADFSTTVSTGVIAGGANQTGTIDFTASTTGSRISVLTIESDDPDVSAFTLNIYGIGTDGLATEPTVGASAITFSNVEAYGMGVSYTPSTDAEGYIVVWKQGSAPTTAPTDGQSYLRGDMVGDAKVAYVGDGIAFNPRGIRANIDYHFAVYAYNGYDNYIDYNQTEVLTGNQMSGGEQIGSYYAGISSTSPNLIDDLTALINPHTTSSYFMYKGLMMDGFEVMDTIGGDSYVVCCYSAERKVFSGAFDWTATGYSREHTYPHSWFPTFPANSTYGQEEDEYIDYHNLYPINQNEANQPRSNLPFGVVEEVLFEYLEGKRGKDANGAMVYEPTDKNKGNAARTVFYMATAYNGTNGTGHNWAIPSNQNQEVLKDWHFQDLPDNYEIARNELIYSIQNNRNPYVDSVDFVCYVDFHTMNYNTEGCEGLGLTNEFVENNLSIFPNPSNEIVYVQLNGVEINSIDVKDMTGRTVGTFSTSTQYVEVDVTNFNAGTYLLNINTERGSLVKRIVVQ